MFKEDRRGQPGRYLHFLLFLTFRLLVANPKKLLYTVANPARGLLNRENITKSKSLAAPLQHCSFEENQIKSRDASTCLGATQVLVRLAPVQDSFGSSTRPIGVASKNSTVPCAFTTFPVSLSLSSPGDVQPRLHLLSSTRPRTFAHPPRPSQPTS